MHLTRRICEVMGVMLMWPGLSDVAYAGLLGISIHTWKSYLLRIREEMGVQGCSRQKLFAEVLAMANDLRRPGTPEITLPIQKSDCSHRKPSKRLSTDRRRREFRIAKKQRKLAEVQLRVEKYLREMGHED